MKLLGDIQFQLESLLSSLPAKLSAATVPFNNIYVTNETVKTIYQISMNKHQRYFIHASLERR